MPLLDGAVSTEFFSQKLPEGVLDMATVEPLTLEGQKVFVYYNGPTDQLSGVSAGACVLEPGMSPHPVHQHPEEELTVERVRPPSTLAPYKFAAHRSRYSRMSREPDRGPLNSRSPTPVR